jgi:hypothetical protein
MGYHFASEQVGFCLQKKTPFPSAILKNLTNLQIRDMLNDQGTSVIHVNHRKQSFLLLHSHDSETPDR